MFRSFFISFFAFFFVFFPLSLFAFLHFALSSLAGAICSCCWWCWICAIQMQIQVGFQMRIYFILLFEAFNENGISTIHKTKTICSFVLVVDACRLLLKIVVVVLFGLSLLDLLFTRNTMTFQKLWAFEKPKRTNERTLFLAMVRTPFEIQFFFFRSVVRSFFLL